MTELNSRFYYGLRLLLKCGHFHATQRNISLVFSLSIASSKILTYIMQSDITIKENTETILQLAANMRISCLRPNLYPVREATLETLCLRTYILFHRFRDQITDFL